MIVICILLGTSLFSQQYNKYSSSYNFKKAMEFLENEDSESALGAFKDEVKEHKDNGYAYLFIASIQQNNENFGEALSAIEYAIKYIPKKDKEYKSLSLYKRAGIYVALNESDKALKDFTSAIALCPDEDYYAERAQIYYELEQYDLADSDYRMMLSLDAHNAMAYMGLGRNHIAKGEYQSATERFDYVISLYPEYSSGYSFRAEARMMLKDYSGASSDVAKALSIDGDNKAFHLMQMLADSSFTNISVRIKSYAVQEPNNYYWPYCLGIVNETVHRYKEAIEYYEKSAKLDTDDIIYARLSSCYEELGDWKMAKSYIDKAIDLDPKYFKYQLSKADIYYQSGDIKSGVAVLDDFIDSNPDFYYGYYRRGWFKDNLGDVDGAIDDYTTSIELNPEYTYAYMSRGKMYLLKGDSKKAESDFNETIRRDSIPESNSAVEYALFYLGRKDDAKVWMQKVIESDPDDAGVYYDAACLYSLMGEIDASISYLETSLLKGYRNIHHIMTDDDLDNIRGEKRYQELIKVSSGEINGVDNTDNDFECLERVTEVPFTRSGGVTKVKCEINGLPLHFVFDTGASDVSLSRVEATFMFKNNYISPEDIIGKARYIDANGDISIGTVINLRKVSFAGLDIENVRASVGDNNNAPLLLGQSVLSRLGKVEIDYERNVLRITTKETIKN